MATIIGTDGPDSLLGTPSGDKLEGLAGNDTIDGGGGNDLIVAGTWAGDVDHYYGGAGYDTVLVNNRDASRNFFVVHDVEQLRGSGSNSLVSVAQFLQFQRVDSVALAEPADFAFGGELAGHIYGSSGADRLDFRGATSTETLYLYGQDGDDEIFAGGLKHATLSGGDGNDTLQGGSTAVALVGAGGDDLIRGSSARDKINGGDGNDSVTAGGGNDQVDGGRGDDSLAGGLGDDSLIGSAGKDTLSGGAGNDTLHDRSAGSDLLQGGAGDDWLVTRSEIGTVPGPDTLLGGAGNDTVLYQPQPGALFSGGAGEDVLRISGTLDLGAFPNRVVGFEILEGNGRDSAVTASLFNLFGTVANMNLYAQGGAVLDYEGALGGKVAATQRDDTLDLTGASRDERYGTLSLLGRGGADSIAGGGGDWLLDGGVGDDTLLGGVGLDTLLGGDGNDSLMGYGGSDSLSGGEGDDRLVGGPQGGNDRLWGDAGNDTLDGTAGQDTLNGGAGDDLVLGGKGNDRIEIDSSLPGADTLDGGAGTDTLYLYGGVDISDATLAISDIEVLEGGAARFTLVSAAQFLQFETVRGVSLADPANLLFSGALGGGIGGSNGDDVLNFSGATIDAGSGSVLVFGQDGDDRILAGGGDGWAIAGEAGRDTLRGGDGDDIFVFAAGDGNDTVQAFEDGSDRLDVAGYGYTSLRDMLDAGGSIVDKPNGALVTFSADGESALVASISAAQLTAADFIFA